MYVMTVTGLLLDLSLVLDVSIIPPWLSTVSSRLLLIQDLQYATLQLKNLSFFIGSPDLELIIRDCQMNKRSDGALGAHKESKVE